MTAGVIIMLAILLSNTGTATKGIGVLLSIMLIMMSFAATGPLKKHFEETRSGTMGNPNEVDYR